MYLIRYWKRPNEEIVYYFVFGRGVKRIHQACARYRVCNFTGGLGPVSQKSRNFSGLFRVPQFLLYLRNTEVLGLQTSQSSFFFLMLKTCKKISFSKQADCSLITSFSGPKRSGDFRETGPWGLEPSAKLLRKWPCINPHRHAS